MRFRTNDEKIMTTIKTMLEQANAVVPKITAVKAQGELAKGNVLILDVRDAHEVEKTGKISGAVNISRGMLEFRADPQSPYYDPRFTFDKTIILYCASGGRSVLAGETLKDMGYAKVLNLGAFKDWVDSNGATDAG